MNCSAPGPALTSWVSVCPAIVCQPSPQMAFIRPTSRKISLKTFSCRSACSGSPEHWLWVTFATTRAMTNRSMSRRIVALWSSGETLLYLTLRPAWRAAKLNTRSMRVRSRRAAYFGKSSRQVSMMLACTPLTARRFSDSADTFTASVRLGHAADEVVYAQELQQAPVNRRVRRRWCTAGRPLERLDLPGEPLLADGPQELGECHRAQIEVFDASDRHRELVVGQHELHQRTGGHDRQRRHLFEEVAKRHEGAGGGLYLVQEQHGAIRQRST